MNQQELREQFRNDTGLSHITSPKTYTMSLESKLIEKTKELESEKSKHQALLDHIADNYIPKEREEMAFEAGRKGHMEILPRGNQQMDWKYPSFEQYYQSLIQKP